MGERANMSLNTRESLLAAWSGFRHTGFESRRAACRRRRMEPGYGVPGGRRRRQEIISGR